MLWNTKYPQAMTLPHSWQQLHNGEHYCTLLTQYFAAWFPKILGYPLLKIGGLSAEITSHIFFPHQIIVTPQLTDKIKTLVQQENTSLVQATTTSLPFINNTMNACLLANILNFSQDPHQVLREINRILTDDGYLFLSFFNPIGPLLFKRYMNKKDHHPLLIRHYLPCRIMDWLELLNFDILECKSLIHNKKTSCFSHLITIVARKRIYPLTLNPQKIRFSKQEHFEPVNAFKETLLRK